MKLLFILICRVLSIALFREEWAAEAPAVDAPKNDIEPGFEYEELPGSGMSEAEKEQFAKDNNMLYRKKEAKVPPPAKTEEPVKPAAKTEDEPNVVEVKADEELTLEKATELVKDYDDDEEIEINGEKLTKTEFLAKFEKADEGDKTYTIGKDTLNQADYNALLADYKKKNDLTDEDIKDVPAKALAKQLEIHSKLENRSKSLNKESQEAANIKRDLARQADYVEGKLKEYEGNKKSLDEKEAELKKIIARKPEEEYEDIYDEDERKEKIADLRMDQKLAKSKLEEVETQKKTTEKNIDALWKRVDDMAYESTFSEINAMIPELKLDEPAYKVLTSKSPKDYTTGKVANTQMRLAKDYLTYIRNNPESEWTVVDYYKINEYLYNPGGPVVKATEKEKPGKTGADAKKKRLLRLIVDQKNTPFSTKPGGGDPVNPLTKEAQKVQKFMEDAGYQTDGKAGVDVNR